MRTPFAHATAPRRQPARRSRTWRRALAALLVLVGASLAAAQQGEPAPAGAALYARQCAACHGASGRGDGPAAFLLDPKPRNFSAGTFRIATTDNGVPSDDDLLGTLRRGMPGSAMPPWEHLSETELRALIAEVRRLVVEGRAADAMAYDDSLGRDEALADALEDYATPGAPAVLPARPATIDLARGGELYARNCAACHGSDGRANVAVEKVDSEGWPIRARDFTRGVFKGGSSPEDIARRIWLGMPGTPMPALPLAGDDLWALVGFVDGLVDRTAEGRVLQARRVLTARRAAGPLDADPDASAWSAAEPAWLAVMPLWWRDDRIEGLEVRALHDGRTLALRLSWSDATRDDELLQQTSFADAVAVQLSVEADPPFFGMGDAASPVRIWHWKAAWQRDAAARPQLADAFPHMPTGELAERGRPQDEVFQTALAAGNPLARPVHDSPVEVAVAAGLGTLATQLDASVLGGGRWADGRWSVVLLRQLEGSGVDVAAALPISAAFAVWDGSAGDRNGSKSVTIWHRLVLEE